MFSKIICEDKISLFIGGTDKVYSNAATKSKKRAEKNNDEIQSLFQEM